MQQFIDGTFLLVEEDCIFGGTELMLSQSVQKMGDYEAYSPGKRISSELNALEMLTCTSV